MEVNEENDVIFHSIIDKSLERNRNYEINES